jgi:lipoate-protein ligase A
MERKWRLIKEAKNDGFYNMALDTTLFLCFPQQKIPTLRIYGWKKPFISLGYNQKIDFLIPDIPFTKRITGGGAILHHQDLTYSLVCGLEDLNLPYSPKKTYEVLSSFLFRFYKKLNLKPHFAKEVFKKNSIDNKQFCYLWWEEFDIVIQGKKIGGNAQRRRKDYLFQHGSIPQKINFSLIKQVIKRIDELEKRTISLDSLLKRNTNFYYLSSLLVSSFKEVFKVDLIEGNLTEKEKEVLNEELKNAKNFFKKTILAEQKNKSFSM